MARLWDWSERLEDVLADFRKRRFEWGESDCIQFVGACIEAVRGDNPSEEFRGTYDDEQSAARVLITLDGRDAPAMLEARFEALGGVLNARRGDLCVIQEPSADNPFGAVGVVVGTGLVASFGPDGYMIFPLASATRAFAVE